MQSPGRGPRACAGAGPHLGRGAARPRPAAPPYRSRPLHTRPTAHPAQRAPARAGSAGIGRPCAARAPLGSAPRAAGPPATRPEQSARAQKHRACVRLPDTTCDLIQLPCAPEPNSPPPGRLCTLSNAAATAQLPAELPAFAPPPAPACASSPQCSQARRRGRPRARACQSASAPSPAPYRCSVLTLVRVASGLPKRPTGARLPLITSRCMYSGGMIGPALLSVQYRISDGSTL